MSPNDTGEIVADGGTSASERSRYVTVLQQIKDTEHYDVGDRFIVHGEQLEDRYIFDEQRGDFLPVSRPIAVIDVGVPITDDDVTDWCNSHAGKHVLARFFPEMDVEDPSLPDAEELVAK